jgi:hypothetical protein
VINSLLLKIKKIQCESQSCACDCLYTSGATKRNFKSFRPLLWRCHHFLRLRRKFPKIQRKIFHQTIFALIWGRKVGIDLIPSPDCCICIAVSKNTHNGHIWRHNGHMAIWPFDAIMTKWQYRHMAIMPSKVDNTGVFGNSNKNAAIW